MPSANHSEPRPYITVIVTAHNYGRFIEEAIDSVLAQEFSMDQVEILIIDDGSTDDTAERVKKYGSQVRYLYQPNGGQAAALNSGFAHARGEIVTILDADDFFLPGKLRAIAEAFEKDPAIGMVYHRLEVWHMDGGKREDWYFVAVSGDLNKEPEKFISYLTPPTLAISFRMSYLNPLLPIPEEIRMLADCYIAALIPYRAAVLAIPEVLAIYRVHGTNAHFTASNLAPVEPRKSKLEMWQIVIAHMRKWLADHGYTRQQPPVRAMMDLWEIILEREEFRATPPGRLRFLRHVLKNYRYQAPLTGWRTAVMNHVDAFGALLVGYEKFPQWVEMRQHVFSHLRGRK